MTTGMIEIIAPVATIPMSENWSPMNFCPPSGSVRFESSVISTTLAEFGAGDADRARLDQLAGDLRDLDAFDVRTPVDAVLVARPGDACDVRLKRIEIDHQRGRIHGSLVGVYLRRKSNRLVGVHAS